jgi:DNA-3-methyladenine glycosylase
MSKLPKDFYLRSDVVQISRDLIGKRICSRINGEYCAAIITETEAYAGVNDKASHAYGGKRTKRTEIMYAEGGVTYVYLCYGIHYLFNVVTNQADIPHAVLIRGLKAEAGISTMLNRRGLSTLKRDSLIGPGKASQALGIDINHNAISLHGDQVWIEESDIQIDSSRIELGPRIGIDYAEEDALLPYRFSLKE